MQGIAKACVIPVCKGRKFTLVHKFPSDKERFAEWLEAIQKQGTIQSLSNLQDEAIR
jgi:THAP domain